MCQNQTFSGVARTLSLAMETFMDGAKVGKHSLNQVQLMQGKVVLKFEAVEGDATWAHVSMMYLKQFLRPTLLLMIPTSAPVRQAHVALRVLSLPPRRVGPQLLARHSWRTFAEMIHRITLPAQTRPGPLEAAQLVV